MAEVESAMLRIRARESTRAGTKLAWDIAMLLLGGIGPVPGSDAAQDFTARGCADHFERDVFSALSRSQFVRGRDSPASVLVAVPTSFMLGNRRTD